MCSFFFVCFCVSIHLSQHPKSLDYFCIQKNQHLRKVKLFYPQASALVVWILGQRTPSFFNKSHVS